MRFPFIASCYQLEQIVWPNDDVIKWNHFPRYWPFVRGIHRSPLNSRTNASHAELLCFFDLRLNKRLSKQSWRWWFETPSRPSWRHCNDVLYDHCDGTRATIRLSVSEATLTNIVKQIIFTFSQWELMIWQQGKKTQHHFPTVLDIFCFYRFLTMYSLCRGA